MKNEVIKRLSFGHVLSLAMIVVIGCSLSPGSDRFLTNVSVQQSIIRAASKSEKIASLPTNDPRCPDGIQFITEHYGWLSCEGDLWRTSDGGQTWKHIYSSKSHDQESSTFRFTNLLLGWSYSMTKIQKTTDGGQNWTPISSPIMPHKGFIGDVRFLRNGQEGWLAGGLFERMPEDILKYGGVKPIYTLGEEALRGVIFYSDNGGNTWYQQSLPTKTGSFISDIYVSNEGKVWAIDDTSLYRLEGNVWRRIDFAKTGCVNQQLLRNLGISENHGDIFDLVTLHFADTTYAWLSLSNGYLSKSTDGGETWCDLLNPQAIQEEPNENTTFGKLYFTDSNKGWGLTRSGKIYETKDGGLTWMKVEVEVKLSEMYFVDAQHGWAISKEGIFRISP